MRRIALAAIFGLALLTPPAARAAFAVPGSPTGYVNDFAKILTPEQKTALDNKLAAVNASTTIQIAIATVPSLGGDTIENAATAIFDSWKIGQAKKDNGILIVVAPNERQTRIEVGYGLEGALTDLQSSWIIQNQMNPAFKTGDYYGGLDAGTDAVISAVRGEAVMPPDGSNSATGAIGHYGFVILIAAIFFMRILAIILGRSKSWWMGGVLGAATGGVIWFFAGLTAGLIAIAILTPLGLLFDFIVSKSYDKWKNGGGRGPWMGGGIGGGGGFGGGGGGFGGFGGGRSGGGGASGGW